MSIQEKKDNSTFHTTGGYLKVKSYKEAWAEFWEKTDKANKDKILNLPNFDAEVFEEITGINVNKKNSCEGKVVTIEDGKKYRLSLVEMTDFKSEKELFDYLKESPCNWVKYKTLTKREHMINGEIFFEDGEKTSLGNFMLYTKVQPTTLTQEEAWEILEKNMPENCREAFSVIRKQVEGE